MVMECIKRFSPGPQVLRDLACTSVGDQLVHAVWRGHLSFQTIYIPEPLERALREWLGVLPTTLRQEVMDRCSNSLLSTIGRVTELSSSTVPIMLAALMEIIYSPTLPNLTVWTDLHWHHEARMKILHLLHSQQSSARKLELSCYKTPIFQFQALSFSERFLLLNVLNKFQLMRELILPYVADDDLLAKLGSGSCPQLELLDVEGSWEVTNQGLASLAGQDGRMVIGRVGWVPSHFTQCSEGQRLLGNMLKGSPVTASQIAGLQEVQAGPKGIVKTLRSLNIEQTSTDGKGIETVMQNFTNLRRLQADEANWQYLLINLSQPSPGGRTGCKDCFPSHLPLTGSISLSRNTYSLLDPLSQLLPHLTHLSIGNYERSEVYLDGQDNLPLLSSFPRLTSLELLDVDLDPVFSYLERGEGPTIRRLKYSSRHRQMDLAKLAGLCPELVDLTVASSVISFSTYISSFSSSSTSFPQLVSLTLRDVAMEGDQACWRNMIKSCPRLSHLTLHNLRLTEADLMDLLTSPLTSNMEEINITASPGTVINLTEETVFKLVDKCPRLRKVGGVCGWSVRDLSSLLEKLATHHRFRLRLDDQGD